MPSRRGMKRRGPAIAGPPGGGGPVIAGPSKPKKRGQECPECQGVTEHLKRHIAHLHLAQWWMLLPLMACWVCKEYEIAPHVSRHGPFQIEQHGSAFCDGVRKFFEFLSEKLGVGFGRLIQVIRDRRLVPRGITFTLPELDYLDFYDRQSGLGKLEYRSAEEPIRLSSLLHCRTIHIILLHIAKVTPAPPPQNKVTVPNYPEKEKPQLVVSLSSTEKERTVQLKSKVVVPAEIILPGEKDVETPFVDCHCHLDRLFSQSHHHGSLEEYFNSKGRFISPFFMGCITVFSDPPTYMCDSSIISTILSENGVNGAIGCHPKLADHYSDQVEEYIRKVAKEQPKIVAIGEMGLDFSIKGIRNSQKRHQRTIFRKQLALAVELKKVVVIHSRDAGMDCFQLAKEVLPVDTYIHVHCYIGDYRDMLMWTRRFPNAFIGITPVCTYRNQDVEEVARLIPLHRLVLESDAPYFLPSNAPRSIRHSDPQMVIQVAKYVAERQKKSVAEVMNRSYSNAMKLYGIAEK